MAIRHVVVEGDEILRKKCREVTEVTDRIKMTLEDMLETMRDSHGVGIAGPQVGVMRRMFVAEPEPGRVYYMINPVILEKSGSQTDDEGCLSVPGMIGSVERPDYIKIEATGLTPCVLPSGTMGFDEARLTLDCRKLFKTSMHKCNFIDQRILELWYNNNPGGSLHDVYIVEIENIFEKSN